LNIYRFNILPDVLVIITGVGGYREELFDVDVGIVVVVGGDVKAIDGICVVCAVVIIDDDDIQPLIDVIHSFISMSSLA
jgi:hypothetical protein